DPAALATTVMCPDETSTTVSLTASLADGSTVADSATVEVGNANPTLTRVAPHTGQQVEVGADVSTEVELSDPGVADVLDCEADWGDGSAVTSCGQPHVFSVAGARTVTVTVTDGDGGSAQAAVGITVVAPPNSHFEFDGFFAPVVNGPKATAVEAGAHG